MLLAASLHSDLFPMGIPVVEKILRTIAVYAGLLVLLRFAGKRDLAQLNSFDLVVLLLLSNVVQNAVIGNDNSLSGGLLGAFTLVAVNAVVVRAFRSNEVANRLFEGTSTDLVRDGAIDIPSVRRLGLRKSDVVNALRRQGASSVGEVELAQLTPGGGIIVELKPGDENATKDDISRLEAKLDRLLTGGRPPADG